MTIIIFILKLSSGISISILIIDDRVTKNPKLPKTQTQERIEINDGQPNHRYVKQAVPARYGPSVSFTSLKL